MLTRVKHSLWAMVFASVVAATAAAQSAGTGAVQRGPTSAARPFIVLTGQSLSDVEQKLDPNKVQELIGGEGMQLRVAVQHDKDKSGAAAELHDASDDVYYVLDGAATLTLGGKLDAPHEVEPGEWRSPRIIAGQTFEIAKGDLIIVPRGTPHQRSTAGKDFSMILIKVYAKNLPASPAKANPPNKNEKP
jgi:mannose-6-phosphate isomerase-like protein (cupin superfamily)